MVTTIKITCDGVFIQTNLQDTIPNERRTIRNNAIERNGRHCAIGSDTIDTAINKTSITVADSNDTDKVATNQLQSPPIITNGRDHDESILFSPILVASSLKTLLRAKQSVKSIDCDESNRIDSMPSTQKLCKIDRMTGGNGRCVRTTNSISTNGKCSDRVIRRRNTIKNYLLECKEQLVRRLSSPTPLIG